MDNAIKKHWHIFLTVVLVTLLLPFLLTRDWGFITFIGLGEVGDVIGGTTAPFLSIFGSILVYLALRSQVDANDQVGKQFGLQQSSNQFYTMLDLHSKNVEDFRINSFESFDKHIRYKLFLNKDIKDEKCNLTTVIESVLKSKPQTVKFEVIDSYKENIIEIKKVVEGRRCFLLLIKDLHFSLYCIDQIHKNLDDKLSPDDQLTLAYRIFFWGTDSTHLLFDDAEKDKIVFKIKDKLNDLKSLIRNNAKGHKIKFGYFTNNGEVMDQKYREENFRFIPLCGHSSRLAHYFRHLYQTAKQIHFDIENEVITKEVGIRFFNTLRAQMSNEEQLLLYYNYRIGFGSKWDKTYFKEGKDQENYSFLTEYKMIHNIPLYNTIFEKVEHPEIHFKNFIEANPGFDLFEWRKEPKS